MVCNVIPYLLFVRPPFLASQSPYGAKWFATNLGPDWLLASSWRSQSPYGAKWFATQPDHHPDPVGPRGIRRNPLTGLSGLQLILRAYARSKTGYLGRNPLTGLSGLQLVIYLRTRNRDFSGSQSPYGAKWFATLGEDGVARQVPGVAIPLRG